MGEFVPNKSMYASKRLDVQSVRFLKSIFPLDVADCQIEEGGSTPNIDGYIDFLLDDGTAYERIAVQVKHLTTPEFNGIAYYDIPKSIYAYSERHKGEVVIFIACDPDAGKFYWRLINSTAIEEYKNRSDHIQDRGRYYFKVEEICSKSNLDETVALWKRLYRDRMSSIKDERQMATDLVAVYMVAFNGINGTFHGMADSHIVREEVARLMSLINTGTEKNLILLTGDAGSGKSVIIKDLIEELRQSSTRVVAIKADTIDDQSNPGWFERVHNTIATLASGEERVVVAIDQIDALSQSMSNDRNRLNAMLNILSEFSRWPNVITIASCRKYDLEFDASLNLLKQKSEIIEVGLLTELELNSVLQQLDCALITQLDPSTRMLLKNAQNLNSFCYLYRNGQRNFHFQNPIELYDALYETVISSQTAFPPTQLEDVLFKIAACIKSSETLRPVWKPSASSQRAFAYLASSGILIADSGSVSFFHQTFYDYVLARNYITRNASFISDLETEFQGLEVRATIKAILEYYRGHDENKYSEELTQLLKSNRIRLHIKLLAVSLMASAEYPRPCEKRVLSQICNSDKRLLVHFLRGAESDGWFQTVLAMAERVFPPAEKDEVLFAPLVSCLARYSFRHPDDIFKAINIIGDTDLRANAISYVLSGHNDYNNSSVKAAYDSKCHDNPHSVIYRITDAINSNPNFAFSRIERLLTSYFEADPAIRRNQGYHIVNELCEKIRRIAPTRLLVALHNSIIKIIRTTGRTSISGLSQTALFDSLRTHYDEAILHVYENLLLDNAADLNTMMPIIDELLLTCNETAVSIAFMVMEKNPKLFRYAIDAVLATAGGVDKYLQGYTEFFFMEMLKTHYSTLLPEEATSYQRWVLSYQSQADMISHPQRDRDELLYPTLWWNKWKLICNTLPIHGLLPEMKKCKGKLMRRFQREIKVRRISHTVGMAKICGGMVADQTYRQFNRKCWLRSFLKLKKDRWNSRDKEPVTVRAHADAFRKHVAESPEIYINLVMEIAAREDINPEYVEAGLEGLIDGGGNPEAMWTIASRFITYEYAKSNRFFFGKIIQFYLNTGGEYIDYIVPILIDIVKQPVDSIVTAKTETTLENAATDMLNHAINSAPGEAMRQIIHLCSIPERRQQGYTIISDLVPTIDVALLTVPLHFLYTTNCFDKRLYFNLLPTILERMGPEALLIRGDAIQWCCYYKRDEVTDFLDMAETDVRTHRMLAQIYYYGLATIESAGFCRERLERIIAGNNEDTIATLVQTSLKTFCDEDFRDFAMEFLRRFADDKRRPVIHAFCAYCDSLPLEALDFYCSLSGSWPTDRTREAYEQLKYLTKCVDIRPVKCLEFVLNQKFTELEDSMFVDEEVVKLLLMIYKKLKIIENGSLLEKIMDMFDEYISRGNRVLFQATNHP